MIIVQKINFSTSTRLLFLVRSLLSLFILSSMNFVDSVDYHQYHLFNSQYNSTLYPIGFVDFRLIKSINSTFILTLIP